MAVGQRPKLTLPILAGMKFLQKMTQTQTQIENDQKKFDRPIFGR